MITTLDSNLFTYEAYLQNADANDVADRVKAKFYVESPDKKWKVRREETLLQLEEELIANECY